MCYSKLEYDHHFMDLSHVKCGLAMKKGMNKMFSVCDSVFVLSWFFIIFIFVTYIPLFYIFVIHLICLCSWWGVGNVPCSLLCQYSLGNFSLNHYNYFVHSYNFLFQPCSIQMCRNTTKYIMGKLPNSRERWPWKLYILSLLLEAKVT